MANTLNFNDIHSVVNAVVKQAVGENVLANVNTGDFVTVASKALLNGYDNYISAVSQVLSSTIFAYREHEYTLDILRRNSQKWGNHERKISPLSMDAVEPKRLPLVDGSSVDPWTIRKRQVIQFNYYGQEDFSRFETIFTNQMDVSLNGPDEFARFMAMIMSAGRAERIQDIENLSRATIANFIGGLNALNSPGTIIHLLTEYNTYTGESFTATDIHKPANYDSFIRWASARMKTIRRNLRERNYLNHFNPTGKLIPRETPEKNQQFIMFGEEYDRLQNSVLSTTFNDAMVNGYGGFEAVNFFQSATEGERNKISVTPSIVDSNGDYTTGAAQTVNNIFALVFDEDAIGITTVGERSYSTPVNPRGEYSNIFWNYTGKFYNDFTEKAVLFLLD